MGTFLPFTHFLVYSQVFDSNNLFHSIGDEWQVKLSGYNTSTIYHHHPDGSRDIIIADENNNLSVNSLNSPGYHSLKTGNTEIENTTVNMATSELQAQFMAIKEQTIERQEGPFLTNIGEFRYKQDDANVRHDQEYFIYYLKSKGVKYELTSTKDEIVRDLEVMQETVLLLYQ